MEGYQAGIAARCSGGPQDSQTVEMPANQAVSKDEELQKVSAQPRTRQQRQLFKLQNV